MQKAKEPEIPVYLNKKKVLYIILNRQTTSSAENCVYWAV